MVRLRRSSPDRPGGRAAERASACAVAVRLLDLGYFRIGNDVYAEDNSFGLTTLERRHVRRAGKGLVVSFTGKSGIEHTITIDDPGRAPVAAGGLLPGERVRRLGDRHEGHGQGLPDLARDGDRGCFAGRGGVRRATETARKRAEVAAMKEVAEFLGTPRPLARSSYVDPRVVDAYEEGRTIEAATKRKCKTSDARQACVERAVLRLLKE